MTDTQQAADRNVKSVVCVTFVTSVSWVSKADFIRFVLKDM